MKMGFKNNLLSWILIGGIGAGSAFVGYYLGSRGNAKESQEIKVEAQGLEDRIKEYFDACLNLNDEKILELFGYQRFVEEYKKEIQNSKYGLEFLPIIKNLTLYVGYLTFLGLPQANDLSLKIETCKFSGLLPNTYRSLLTLIDQNVLPSEVQSRTINEDGTETILAGNVFVHIKNVMAGGRDLDLVEELHKQDQTYLIKELKLIKEMIQKYKDEISVKVRDCKIYPYTFYLRKPFAEKGEKITENVGLIKVEVYSPKKLREELKDALRKINGFSGFRYALRSLFSGLYWPLNTFRQGYILIQDENGKWNIFGSSIDLRGLLKPNWREFELPYNLFNLLCSRASSSPDSHKLYLGNKGKVFRRIIRNNLF